LVGGRITVLGSRLSAHSQGVRSTEYRVSTPNKTAAQAAKEAVERTLSWLDRFRRLKIRYDHRADIHLACLQLGCALTSLRFLG